MEASAGGAERDGGEWSMGNGGGADDGVEGGGRRGRRMRDGVW